MLYPHAKWYDNYNDCSANCRAIVTYPGTTSDYANFKSLLISVVEVLD